MNTLDWQRTSLVLVGDFNPKIYHPAWFAAQELISSSEAEAATVEVLNHDVCIIKTAWLRLEVFRERFLAMPLENGRDEEVRDLAVGAFRILKHTPVRMLGINTSAGWHFPDEATWHAVGHQLVPKETLWDAVLDSPGMEELAVAGKRTDGHEGRVRVSLRPVFKDGRYGVEVQVNDHFQVDQPQAVGGAERAVALLGSAWDRSLAQAGKVFAKLMELPRR